MAAGTKIGTMRFWRRWGLVVWARSTVLATPLSVETSPSNFFRQPSHAIPTAFGVLLKKRKAPPHSTTRIFSPSTKSVNTKAVRILFPNSWRGNLFAMPCTTGLSPPDPTGVNQLVPILVAPDAKAYFYGLDRRLCNLYVVSGVK
jgi:hypothetical protein